MLKYEHISGIIPFVFLKRGLVPHQVVNSFRPAIARKYRLAQANIAYSRFSFFFKPRYISGRKLNRTLIERLSLCEYITEYRNIFIAGATGNGKTYRQGMEVCKQRFKTKYVRLLDLLLDLEIARTENNYRKVLTKYANPRLLILDKWLLLKLKETEQHDILELLHAKRKKSSTIICSQYHDNGWYDQLGGDDSPLAEAILDRIKYDAYKIHIIPTNPANHRSMHEVYGL